MATPEEEARSMTVAQLRKFLESCPDDSPVTIEPMSGLPGLEIAATTRVKRVAPGKDEAVLSIRVQLDQAIPSPEASSGHEGYSCKLERKLVFSHNGVPLGDDKEVNVYAFKGPGMPQYANSVVVWRPHDAEHLARLLSSAFTAGRKHQRERIRDELGINSGPFGMSTS